ncbi:MAG TPA: hypothetical protein VGE45_00455 [Chloroflexia bacterium]|jgi:hypothetical protein
MSYKDPEKQKQWYIDNRERVRESQRRNREKNIEMHRQKDAAWARKRRRVARNAVVDRLGGRCVGCGNTDVRLLAIHHTQDDGSSARKKYGNSRGGSTPQYYLAMLKQLDMTRRTWSYFAPTAM